MSLTHHSSLLGYGPRHMPDWRKVIDNHEFDLLGHEIPNPSWRTFNRGWNFSKSGKNLNRDCRAKDGSSIKQMPTSSSMAVSFTSLDLSHWLVFRLDVVEWCELSANSLISATLEMHSPTSRHTMSAIHQKSTSRTLGRFEVMPHGIGKSFSKRDYTFGNPLFMSHSRQSGPGQKAKSVTGSRFTVLSSADNELE